MKSSTKSIPYVSVYDELFAFTSKYIELTDEEKMTIIDFGIFKHFPKGTILLEQGKFTKDSYIVIKGCLRTYYLIDGEEKTSEFYTEMDTLAPISAVHNKPSEYTIVCVEDCILGISNPEIEIATFEKYPRLETVCRLVSEDLVAKNQAAFDLFKLSSPEERYQQLLKTRPDLIQRVPQHQIASYLGMKPETLSRIRKRMFK